MKPVDLKEGQQQENSALETSENRKIKQIKRFFIKSMPNLLRTKLLERPEVEPQLINVAKMSEIYLTEVNQLIQVRDTPKQKVQPAKLAPEFEKL